MPAFIDKYLGYFVSKKLLVLIIATCLVLFAELPSEWVNVAMIYIGGQAVVDAVKALRGA